MCKCIGKPHRKKKIQPDSGTFQKGKSPSYSHAYCMFKKKKAITHTFLASFTANFAFGEEWKLHERQSLQNWNGKSTAKKKKKNIFKTKGKLICKKKMDYCKIICLLYPGDHRHQANPRQGVLLTVTRINVHPFRRMNRIWRFFFWNLSTKFLV